MTPVADSFAASGGGTEAVSMLGRYCSGDLVGQPLDESTRRSLVRIDVTAPAVLNGGDGGPLPRRLLVKRYPVPSHRARRERARRAAGFGPARREYAASRALASAGAPVARALGWARTHEGEELLLRPFETGVPLRARLTGEPTRERRAALEALANASASLHDAGWLHGDLHLDNALWHDARVLFLDVGRARRSRSRRAQRRELARLDHSLARAGVSLTDRVRFRRTVCDASGASEAARRAAVRAIGRASERFAFRHARGRTRRTLRGRRRHAPVAFDGWVGVRMAAFPLERLESAVRAHASAGRRADVQRLKDDHRARVSAVDIDGHALIVKQVVKPGGLRRLADAVRGSPARRAWLAGHGLCIRGFAASTPLAFLERRVAGVPVDSLVVLEDLRPHPLVSNTPHDHAMSDGAQAARALTAWLVRLHRCGVRHGDLQATHIHWLPRHADTAGGGRAAWVPALIDLEGVRFTRRLRDDERIRALAELNASIPNERMGADARRSAFLRYAAALPFSGGRDGKRRALERIVAQSLERNAAWRGCAAEHAGREPLQSAETTSHLK